MKKLVLIAACAMFAFGAQAQDEAKSEASSSSKKMWLGGSGGFSSGSFTDENQALNNASTFEWHAGPEFGFMLGEKAAVGISLLLQSSATTYDNLTEDKNGSFGYEVTPFFRYYFASYRKFKFFGQFNVGFGGGATVKDDNTAIEYKDGSYSTLNIGIVPGIQYWFTDNWSMTSSIGLLGYGKRSEKTGYKDINDKDIEESVSGFAMGADLADLNFSLIFHF